MPTSNLRLKWLSAACLPVGLLQAGALAAADPEPNRAGDLYTMSALVQEVSRSNPQIAGVRNQVRVAQARLASTRNALLPAIAANGVLQRRKLDVKNGGPGDAEFTAGQANVEARMRLYDGNRSNNTIKVARQELASLQAVLDSTESDVLLDLLTAAADVHRDRQITQYAKMQSEAISQQLKATSRRLQFGEATGTDEALARARLASSEATVLSAEEDLAASATRFTRISGQPGSVVPPLPATIPLPESLPAAHARALAASPRLIAAKRTAAAAGYAARFASGALYPQIDAVGGYEYLTGGVANLFTGKLPDDRSAAYGGVEVRVPIFQPRDYSEIRRARAFRDQRFSEMKQAERVVTEEVAIAWSGWRSAQQTIDASRIAVAAQEQAAEGVRREWIGGNRTLNEVLDAQNQLLNARVTLERSIRNEFVARASVLAAIGALQPEAILPPSESVPPRPGA